MITVIFDAGPLITACKFMAQGQLVIDHLLASCQIVIAERIEEEVAVLGGAYPDGVIAGERIADGKIQVLPVVKDRWKRHLSNYALGAGEQDSIELWEQVDSVTAFVTDDHLAFLVATRLGLKCWMLPDLVIQLTVSDQLTIEVAKAILLAIRSRYRGGAIEHSFVDLEELKDAKSSHTS